MIKTCLESYHQIQPISLDLGVAPLFIFVNQSKKNLVKGNVSQIRAFKVTRMSQFMRHECLKEVILLHKLLAYYNRNMVWHHEWNENRNYILYYTLFINYNNQLLSTNIKILFKLWIDFWWTNLNNWFPKFYVLLTFGAVHKLCWKGRDFFSKNHSICHFTT